MNVSLFLTKSSAAAVLVLLHACMCQACMFKVCTGGKLWRWWI